jgi:cytoskeletal protein CcmA (bactofilin family)
MFEFSKKGSPEDTPARETTQPEAAPAAEASPRARPAPVSGARREAAIIGPSIQLDGDLRGQEDLLIEGEVNGTVQLRNNSLTVGSQGKVKAHVYAKEIHVEGVVEGDLFASERVSIRRSAQVRGNITSPRVILEEGARFKGSIEMDSEAVEAALGTSAKASPGSPRAAAAPAPRANAAESRDQPAGSPAGGAARSGVTS